MSLRRISSVTKDELITIPIRDFDLWPMAPSGTLIEPSHKYKVSEDSKQHMLDFERSMEHVEKFFQTKATIMQWYIATIIGILGNIFVAIIFTESIQLYNARITMIILLLLIIITRIGIEYMPSYSLRYTIIGDYIEFPKGYERYIDIEEIKNPIIKAHISMNFMHDVLTEYGIFIRYCLIKDALIHTLKNLKYIKVDKITQLSPHIPSYDISFSTNLYALLRPRNQDEIIHEFMQVNGATLRAKMSSGVYAFELNRNAWEKKGANYLNEISLTTNDFKDLNERLVSVIRNSTNSAFRRDLSKRIHTFIDPRISYLHGRISGFSSSIKGIFTSLLDKVRATMKGSEKAKL